VAYVSMAHTDSLGLVLAVVQPDLSLRSDGNSLFLWRRQHHWKSMGRLIRGGREPVHIPTLLVEPEGAMLVWKAWVPDGGGQRSEGRLMLDPLGPGPHTVHVIDPDLVPFSNIRSARIAGRQVFITMADENGDSTGHIRFVGVEGNGVRELGRVPNPYQAGFHAASTSPAGLLLNGPLLEFGDSTVVTLLLRIGARCAGQGPRGRDSAVRANLHRQVNP
ncbi:MAG TPA: hypothetical protein VFQ45_23365, partial [Longimicrobium sp.]|nr:hypothetical protein [Longimicrobium sp.]